MRKLIIVLAMLFVPLAIVSCVVPPAPRPVPITSPPSPPGPPPGTVGYLGCSNTAMAIDGYHRGRGPGRIWATLPFGGGSIDQWVTGSTYWRDFDAERTAHPVTSIWWHVCMQPFSTQADVERVLSELRSRVGPSIPVYATKMATYSVPGSCAMAGVEGSAAIVDYLVLRGMVERGPALHEITPTTTIDGCHPTDALASLDGDNLAAFFP